MPVESLGAFATLIPAPLGLGRVALADGREVTGFICEGYAAPEPRMLQPTGAGDIFRLNNIPLSAFSPKCGNIPR